MDNTDFIFRLDETTNDILEMLGKVAIEQLNYKQGKSWSILEVLEHLYLTDKVIYMIISRPSDTINSHTEIVGKETLLKTLVEQRENKITSPDLLKPKGDIRDLTPLLDMFVSQRNELKNGLLSNEILIDNRVHRHPFLGEMTITDWLNFTIHHTQRHIEQIKDIVIN